MTRNNLNTCNHPVRSVDERGNPYCGVCGGSLQTTHDY